MSNSSIFISGFSFEGTFTGSLPVDSVEEAAKKTFTLSDLTLRKDEDVSGLVSVSFPSLVGKMHLDDATEDVEFFIGSQVTLDIVSLFVTTSEIEVEPQVTFLGENGGDVALRYGGMEPPELTV